MTGFRDRFHERHHYQTMSEPRGGPMSEEILAEFQQVWEKDFPPTYHDDLTNTIDDMVYSVADHCPPIISHLIQDYMNGWEEEYCKNVLYEKGPFLSRFHTVFGVRDGTCLTWREDGTPWIRCQYVAGEKHGYCEVYRNGKLSMDFLYSHGKKIHYRSWNDSKLESVFRYQNGSLHGMEEHYFHDNGRLSTEYTNENGGHHGPYREWSADGTLQCEGNYKHRHKHGKWIYHDGSVEYYYHGTKVRR